MHPNEIQQLQLQIARDNERAYRQLFDHFYPRLLQFVTTFIKDEMSAEEIVEDIFVNIWNQRHKLPEIGSLSFYLYAAARKRSLSFLSGRAKDLLSFIEEYPEGLRTNDLNPESLLMSREMAGQISAAVQALPPKCRLVYTLVREHQLKYREVAGILDISEHTVDAQMTNAIKRIAASIQPLLSAHRHRKK
ncbi:MAG: RNA polymerase sigma-70 factor [Chitinophaga sp.]|jgi:RNA polymerase sigma-70 factor (ECF subfamily)